MYFNRNKFIMKNIIYTIFIVALVTVATNRIYYKFKDLRNIDYSSSSLDVVFHSKTADRISITKVTPITDSVGLSTQAYALSVINNLTESVTYKIKLVDDINAITNDGCNDKQIPKENIRVAIKEDSNKVRIYKLAELEDNTIDIGEIKALDKKEYTIRLWVSNEEEVNVNTNFHYHGIIQVVENENEVALSR